MQVELILYDTEFTAWPGSNRRGWNQPWEHKELIQLAAVRVSYTRQSATVVGSFNELIKPSINPQLSDYISQLTGISQHMLDEMGVDFASALASFMQFCQQSTHGGSNPLPCYAWGLDAEILVENCQLYQIAPPPCLPHFANLKALAKRLQLPAADANSGELAHRLQLSLQGHQHNALYDVKSLALALDYWLSAGLLTPEQLVRAC